VSADGPGAGRVHVSPDVGLVRELLRPATSDPDFADARLRERLEALVEAVRRGVESGHRGVEVLVRNHLPARARDEELFQRGLDEDELRGVVAADHGFAAWDDIPQGPDDDRDFEAAVDRVVGGDLDGLARALARNPSLVRGRSAHGHRATLLHYLSANGVEIRRQTVPANAPRMARTLLAAGADPLAGALLYGGALTVRELVRTSEHPWRAGVGEPLVELLRSVEDGRGPPPLA
jgi:hypothetical protein